MVDAERRGGGGGGGGGGAVLSLVRLSVEGATTVVARVKPIMALIGADPRSFGRSLEARRDDELVDSCESISITSSSSSSTWT